MDIDYSIVIPAYNEERLLGATLKCVADAMRSVADGLAPLNGEVIVVDNNSTDNTAAIAAEAGTQVVFEPVNRIASARNAGGRAACGRYILFLDADTPLTGDLLTAVLLRLESGEFYGGGARITFDTKVPLSAELFTNAWAWYSRTFGVAAGCFVYCLREAFDDVGGFPTELYAGEELYFCKRLKKWGRQRGLRFSFLDDPPVVTSARRLQTQSIAQLLVVMVTLGLFRPLLRSRWFCGMWYGGRSKQKA
ncbi:MAG: glycosyltransferase [Thermoguttaceae bacterium]